MVMLEIVEPGVDIWYPSGGQTAVVKVIDKIIEC
jgi:hypothetical protein